VETGIFLQRGLDTNLPDGQITALKALQDLRARAKIVQRIDRLELGNPGDAASVGEGVSEMRIHYGPGYRVHIGSAVKHSLFYGVAETRARKQQT
jgi:putative addiction module killer protein